MRFWRSLFRSTPAQGVTTAEITQPEEVAAFVGPIARMHQEYPNSYLAFLGMVSADTGPALARLAALLAESQSSHAAIEGILKGTNWRPHILGVAAVLVSAERVSLAPLLWRTFDHGSWVAPQLAAGAYIVDPDFVREAQTRVVARCVGTAPHLDDPRVHAKNLASLLGLLQTVSGSAEFAVRESQREDVRTLLAHDIDSAGQIAQRWLANVQLQLASLERLVATLKGGEL